MTKILKKRRKLKNTKRAPDPVYLTFLEHLYELRRRLFYIAAVILTGTLAAYFIQQKLVSILLKPSHGQKFIYTSPGGGITFLFEVCLYFGIAISIPVIIYQFLRFIEPVILSKSKRFILRFSILSGVLAFLGMVFSYFLALPICLNFLIHQFTTSQIQPLFTIQEYMSFVSFYLVGSALLFQIPLLMWFINYFKPQKPRNLLKYEKYIIIAAFIISALMAPTINIFSQLVIAVPFIASYQVGIILVWLINKRRLHPYSNQIMTMLEVDKETRFKRVIAAQQLKPVIDKSTEPIYKPNQRKVMDIFKSGGNNLIANKGI